ncbi:CHASE3 domain-containing protein [Lederbergia citrea]|uniref:Chemotaxis methyl-accepting receptor HlyB-like 4HB MCP domain-containing protein n=1 Tax=Lederbergia citrea TaxID=2833581 RepID=A0A942ULE9_9BACI|nr:hypothetical protein [Lederbergia citrea]MBS4223540.1 hypothetical protein [Lederbergia citrea]
MRSLKGKILSGFLIVIGLVLIMGGANFLFTTITNNQTAKVMDEELPVLLLAEKLNQNITERTSLARGYLLYGQKAYFSTFEAATEESRQLEKELLALAPTIKKR